jgi:hypothetical protein
MISATLIALTAIAQSAVGADTPSKADRGTLEFRIVEQPAAGAPVAVPARVHLADAGGNPVLAPGLPGFRDHFNCDGSVRLELPAGRYTYTVERGPEYRRVPGELKIEAGTVTRHEVLLRRLIDLAALGWFSGETHVHRTPDEVPLLLRSEDLHVAPVMTVWNQTNLWNARPLPERLVVESDPTRLYHLLACEDERRGGALLYFNLVRPLALADDGPEFPSPVARLREAVGQKGAWVDVEKPFWWDAPTWVATGRVNSVGLANNHMCRSVMYEDEAWGRPRDPREFPAPRGNGFYTQSLYYRLLNCGLRLPPSAGSASGVLPNPVGYNRVYVHLDGKLSYDAWWAGLASGRSFVTNGPLLLVTANGRLPGEVLRPDAAGPVPITLDVRVLGDDPLEAIEVVRDGLVVERIAGKDVRERVRPRSLSFAASGWFLVRAIAAVPATFRFASTAPFYVEIGSSRSTIHRDDVEFFMRWIDDRIAALEQDNQGHLRDPQKKEQVLAPHRQAQRFFKERLREAQ